MRFLRMAAVLLAACSVNAGDSKPGEASAETKALFATLPAATPDVLRGVWSATFPGDGANAEVRIRFTDGKLLGGIHCTNGQNLDLMIGTSTTLTTDALDKKSGEFQMTDTLTMKVSDSNGKCEGSVQAATWGFAITGTSLSMSSLDPKLVATFTKVGD